VTGKRGIGANSALALAGDGASKLGALVVVVAAARLVSVEQFAILATALAAAGVVGSMLDLGAGTLLARDGAKSRADRGALLDGLLRARVPMVMTVLVVAPVVGIWLGQPLTVVAAAGLGVTAALGHTVYGLYRSCQDLRPEALQRLAAAMLSVGVVALVPFVVPRADAVLVGLAGVAAATLWPLVHRAPDLVDASVRVPPRTALRLAAPIGLLALATIVYYRSGMLALAALADANETAAFGVAAGIAFGLLALPNAITTALLPRLASEDAASDRIACARRALASTLLVAVVLAGAAAVVVPIGMPIVLGGEYGDAGVPFALLCLGIPVIATSGVIGTALLSIGRLGALGAQVGLSLAINLASLALLVPPFGAVGAALATVACEAAGLVLLVWFARTALPGLLTLGPIRLAEPIEAAGSATP
jgi:O-antigen/teichoic acid export membrane protein